MSILFFQNVYNIFEIFQIKICGTFDTEKEAENACGKKYTFCHTGARPKASSLDNWLCTFSEGYAKMPDFLLHLL